MEQFRIGDIVLYPKMRYYYWNQHKLVTIEEVYEDSVKLKLIDEPVPICDIEPVAMDSKAARAIYADITIAAPTCKYGEPAPIIQKDLSFFMDSFKKCTMMGGRSAADILAEQNFEYVHEVQHFIRQNDEFMGITLRYI